MPTRSLCWPSSEDGSTLATEPTLWSAVRSVAARSSTGPSSRSRMTALLPFGGFTFGGFTLGGLTGDSTSPDVVEDAGLGPGFLVGEQMSHDDTASAAVEATIRSARRRRCSSV